MTFSGYYSLLTLSVGAILLAVSRSSVRRIEARILENPLNAGAIGFGALVGSALAVASVRAVVALLTERGLPPTVGFALALSAVVVPVLLTLANTIGIILAGSALLRHFGDGSESNPWLALVVGTVVVNLLYLIPVVNILVIVGLVSVATGGIVGQWWHDR
ncbi:hypothetical protein [Natronorubrum halophilum]|uniref:hypothetical protein n=1 Tax=Natronorubrum halophilum TaxID=1702106 RepID=UPI000EF6C662|nr:hypothetical protein [Natronorubrum halophilum]